MTRIVRLAIVLAATLIALLIASSAQARVPRIDEHTLTCEGLRAKVEVPITWRDADAPGEHKASVTLAVFARGDNPSASKAIYKKTEYKDLPAKGTQTIVHAHRLPAAVSRKLCSGHASLGIYTSHKRNTDDDKLYEIIYLDRSIRYGHKVAAPEPMGAGPTCWLIQAGADLHSCDLSGHNLTSVDLSNADLSSAYMFNANLTSANLTNAYMPYTNLASAYMPSATLTNATLTKAILTNATLTRAEMSGANLANAEMSGAYMPSANMPNANLTNAYLAYADLSYANLTGANLTGANLTYVTWNATTCPNGLVGPYPCS